MSNSTPPGWYPVPGPGPDGSASQERWWDGNAWSSEVRPAAPAAPVDRPPAAAQIADAPTQAWQSPAPAPPQPGFGPAEPQPGAGYGYPPAGAPGYGYPPGGAPGGAPGYGYPGAQGQPGYPPGAMYQPGPPAPRRNNNAVVIGVVVAVLLVGGIAAALALNSGDNPTPHPGPTLAGPTGSDGPATPSGSPSRRPSPSASPRSSAPAAVTGTAPDTQHAITVPILAGWAQETPSSSTTVFLTSGHYTCPGGGDCVRGQFAVKTDAVQGATARAAAEAAMPDYAAAIFDGLVSHTDAGSAATSVAGVSGYAARWHVTTKDGLSGYVLLAAVPAEHGGYVVFHGGVDDDPQAPGPAALEQILKSIAQDGSAAANGA